MPELAQQSLEQERLLAPLNNTLAEINPVMQRLTALREQEIAAKRPVSLETARLARSADSALRAFAKGIPASDLAKKKVEARGIYEWFAKLLGNIVKRVEDDREYCSSIMQTWDREQKAEAERAALKQEARQREFAAEHFPDMPIVVPHVERPRLDGVNIRDFWTTGRILNPVAFAKYLLENPHHLAGVKFELNKNYWKSYLNGRSGTERPEIPGLEIVQAGSTTNRGNGGE